MDISSWILGYESGLKNSGGSGDTGGGSSGGGGAEEELKDVCFWDYDGTLLHSYTLEEAQALTALPAQPTHEGLVGQGWNWSLEDVKALTRPMDIGALYVTDDGATRFYISITDKDLTVTMNIGQSVEGAVSVDWGDGSAQETLSGTTVSGITHTYSSSGDYVVSVYVSEGRLSLGSGSSSRSVFVGQQLRKVEFGGSEISCAMYAFTATRLRSIVTNKNLVYTPDGSVISGCYSLEFFVDPGSTSYIYVENCRALSGVSLSKTAVYGSFSGCYALKRLNTAGFRQVAARGFLNCYNLESVDFSEYSGVYIYENAFYACSQLKRVVFHGKVSQIYASAFSGCVNVEILDFSKCTSVPTLISADAFSSIATDCKILVPSDLLASWKTASNWSTYADYLVGV